MSSILFLDIDGVLAIDDDMESVAGPHFNADCVSELNTIIQKTGCKIILSSDWGYQFGLKTISDIFRWNGCEDVPVGVTFSVDTNDATKLEEQRAEEINLWLELHGLRHSTFAIVDDMDLAEFFDNFTRTKFSEGLTTEGVTDRLIELLNREN